MKGMRGLRGATTAPENSADAIRAATRELLESLAAANELRPEDIASAIFAVTPDLDAAFPAQAARALGWTDTALLDTASPAVPGDLPRCIRVLIHWNTERNPHEIVHVYLRGAIGLRPDWNARVFNSERSPE